MNEITLSKREYEDLLETSIRAKLLAEHCQKETLVYAEEIGRIMDFEVPKKAIVKKEGTA